jgi:hypothetical protein
LPRLRAVGSAGLARCRRKAIWLFHDVKERSIRQRVASSASAPRRRPSTAALAWRRRGRAGLRIIARSRSA